MAQSILSNPIENAPIDGAESDMNSARSLGTDIRALRKSRNLTLSDLANHLNRSVGFVSQIERGLSQPSIDDLHHIADLFDVPLSLFFGKPNTNELDERRIVRAGSRRTLGNQEAGLLEELLSPDLGGTFEIIRSVFAPGAELKDTRQRATEEAGYLVSGALELEISGIWYALSAGDSFRFANEPYRWRNRSNEPAVVIWIVSPPTY